MEITPPQTNGSPIDPSPIAPGQHWTNTIAVAIPAQTELSILSTLSPLIQIGHILTVKVISSGQSIPSNGIKKHPITVSDHYRNLERIEPPTQAVGAVGKIIIAPPTPKMSSQIVPSPCLQLRELSYFGGTSDSIAGLPGAGLAPSVPHTRQYFCAIPDRYYLSPYEWKPGSVPEWINPT